MNLNFLNEIQQQRHLTRWKSQLWSLNWSRYIAGFAEENTCVRTAPNWGLQYVIREHETTTYMYQVYEGAVIEAHFLSEVFNKQCWLIFVEHEINIKQGWKRKGILFWDILVFYLRRSMV